VRGCAAQGVEFENWPFDSIVRTVGPDETQRKALEGLRDAAKQAAQKLAADCPQDVPAAPAARLEAAEQGIDAALKAFDIVEPKLQAFCAALNDEQKSRLYQDMAAPAPRPRPARRRRPARARRGTIAASAIRRAASAGALMPPRVTLPRAMPSSSSREARRKFVVPARFKNA
jgi:hypothetical protein